MTLIKMDKWDERTVNEVIESHGEDLQVSNMEDLYKDLWASYFKPEPEVQEVEVPWKGIIEQMMQTSEYSEVHESCMLEEFLAGYAAGAAFNELSKKMEESEDFKNYMQGKGNESDVQEDLLWIPAQISNKVSKKVKEVKTLLEMGGYSKDGAGKPQKIDKDSIEATQRHLNSVFMQKVITLWGRMKNMASAVQMKKTVHGFEEVDDIGLGNNLTRLVPSEILNWKLNPSDFKKRYTQRRLSQITLKGTDKKAKGPLVVLVDTSGSMRKVGRIEWAKALALTMLQIGKKQKRNVYLCDFSDSRHTRDLVYTGTDIKPDMLYSWLSHFEGGGTNWDYPLKKAVGILKEQAFKEGQILLITDGEAYISDGTRELLQKETEVNDVSVKALLLGFETDSLNFCDEVIPVSSFVNDGKVLEKVFNV